MYIIEVEAREVRGEDEEAEARARCPKEDEESNIFKLYNIYI